MSICVKFYFLLCAAVVGCAAGTETGFAQNTPNHFDPATRKATLELSHNQVMRFLITDNSPPLGFKDKSGRLIGFNVDLVKAVCQEIAMRCALRAWPGSLVAAAILTGLGDAATGVTIDETTASNFLFSRSYLHLPGRFVGSRKDEAFDPLELRGRVGVSADTPYHLFLLQSFPALNPVLFRDTAEVLEAIANGRVPFGFVDGMHASFLLNRTNCCVFLGDAYHDPVIFGPGLTVAVSQQDTARVRAINIGLSRIMENGKFAELYLKWFPVGFY